MPTVAGKDRAAPGVEQLVVFQYANRLRHRIERAAALRQHVVPGDQRASEPGAVKRLALGAHVATFQGAGAAVEGEGVTIAAAYRAAVHIRPHAPDIKWDAGLVSAINLAR